MNKTNGQNMEQHVTILGWLYIAMNALMVGIALIVFMSVVGGGLLSGDPDAIAVTTLVGFGISTFMLVLAVPGFLAGYGLLKHKSWARPLAFVLAALNLFSFPVGTAIAVYTFWVLMQDDVIAYFKPKAKVVY